MLIFLLFSDKILEGGVSEGGKLLQGGKKAMLHLLIERHSSKLKTQKWPKFARKGFQYRF